MVRFLSLLLALCFLSAHADDAILFGENNWSKFEYDFDANTKPWLEVQHQFPAYPKSEHYAEISLEARSSNHFFVDFPSVSVGDDGVVRYSMVVVSPSGAQTVNFEGMLCATGERKLYAFGHGDDKGGGEWARNRYARWEPIRGGHNNFRAELFAHYFCTVEGAANLANIQHYLKTGGLYSSD
jgi:hypothetical protein